ncbi:MAG TPA: DUF4173 domain-containing protein [Nitriliruptorales bacterium]
MTTTTVEPASPPSPPEAPATVDSRSVQGPGRLVALALLGGVALDLGLRGGVTNLAVTMGALAAVAAVLTRPGLSRQAAPIVLTAAVPATFLSVWTSPWLAAANLGAVIGLLAMALAFSGTGTVFDTSVRHVAARVIAAAGHGVSRAGALLRVVPAPRSEAAHAARRTGRAVVLALPLLVALVALLASADAVFASLIAPDVDAVPLLGHGGLASVLAGLLAFGALSVGSRPHDTEREGAFQAAEIAVVLGLAVAVLGLFVVSQLLATTDAGQRLVEQAGLTPAEHARSGFFQLCWACLVIVGYLALSRRLAAPGVFERPVVRGLSAAVPVLALGLVGVSLRRMALYDRAFGLTMLRLAVVVAVVWIGIVLVMIATRNLGVHAERNWLTGAAVTAGLALLLVVNAIDPEGFVVRHNVARAAEGAAVDVAYLTTLSDDALPALAGAIDAAGDPDLRARLVAALRCGEDRTGVAALNVAALTAASAREGRCR